MRSQTSHLITALVHKEFVERVLCRLRLACSQHYHVFTVCVLVVSDVGYAVERVSGKDTLLLVISDLDAILG